MEKLERFLGIGSSTETVAIFANENIFCPPTCPDLEKNWEKLFDNIGTIRNGVFSNGRKEIARIGFFDIKYAELWLDSVPQGKIPILIKNPDSNGSVKHRFGEQNGLFITNEIIFAAVPILHSQDAICVRPIVGLYQAQFRKNLMKIEVFNA
jgi:hypothetical protein